MMQTVGKAAFFALVALVGATQAQAEGFVCRTAERDLEVKVYHQTNPKRGTRNAAVMVLSDPRVGYGRQTIAKFTSSDGTLFNSGSTYIGNADPRVLISQLGEVETVILDVKFSYSSPMRSGESTLGELVLVERDGRKVSKELVCVRYLKQGNGSN